MVFTNDFDFVLNPDLIAQSPASPRDQSKLMLFDTANDRIVNKKFFNIIDFLLPGDVLVLNTSKVIKARIIFFAGDQKKEILFLKEVSPNVFDAMVFPGKFFQRNRHFKLDYIDFIVLQINEDGTRRIRFDAKDDSIDIKFILDKFGQLPLPPYIMSNKSALIHYQTIYANTDGSIAAPTAGLHFTNDLLRKIKNKGIIITDIILHVGRGTFLPVKSRQISDHKMHEEEFFISRKTADILNLAMKEQRRIIAVGSTSTRVLESSFNESANDGFQEMHGKTNIFIYPGKHRWRVINAMITNFHLPKSTLIMLVAAFLENKGFSHPIDEILNLYGLAIKNNYRFYSYGDAMFIF